MQLTSALFCQIRKFMIGGFTPPVQANQCMGSVSQPIIAATEQLGVYAPLLRGLFYLTLFTQFTGSPRRLSLTKPDESPLHRLAASDRQLRIWRRNCCHSPGDRLVLRWGAGAPPIHSGFTFVPIQGTGGR